MKKKIIIYFTQLYHNHTQRSDRSYIVSLDYTLQYLEYQKRILRLNKLLYIVLQPTINLQCHYNILQV